MLTSFGLRGTLKFDFCHWNRSDIVHLKGALYGCKRAAMMSQAAWAWLHFHPALIEDAATGNAGPAFGDQPSRARPLAGLSPSRRSGSGEGGEGRS